MPLLQPLIEPTLLQDLFSHYRGVGTDPWAMQAQTQQGKEGSDAKKQGTTEGQHALFHPHSPHWFTPHSLIPHPAWSHPFAFPHILPSWSFPSLHTQTNSHPSIGSNGVTTTNGRGTLSPFISSALWPRVDLHESPEKFTLSAELAGVPKNNVQVHLNELRRTLEIRGEVYRENNEGESERSSSFSSQDKDKEKETTRSTGSPSQQQQQSLPVYSERIYGSFSRTLQLPENVNLRGIQADFDQEAGGLLLVELPKEKPDTPPKRDEVREITIGDRKGKGKGKEEKEEEKEKA